MSVTKRKIGEVLVNFGMDYAKGVIMDRSIPSIDALKPSQRRIIYTMSSEGYVDSRKAKCTAIVGKTMLIHPHGDASIYDALAEMTDENEKFNIPYIKGKGSFGKVYSRDMEKAKMRYPEASLTKYGNDLCEDLKYDAVDMVWNFDQTLKEPVVLPVRYPNILVNPIAGIAVGKSCCLPCFTLSNVCKATADIIEGKVKTPEELAEVLEYPEYTCGGYIHSDLALMTKLCTDGKATFKISGDAEVYKDRIIITNIPFTTTCEEIIDRLTELVKDGEFNEISNIHNEISKKGMQITVRIKRGYDAGKVLAKICRYTKLRDSISYQIKVIYNNMCVEDIGVLDLLKIWIEFREECVRRISAFKAERLRKEIHRADAWKMIGDRVELAAKILANNNEETVKELYAKEFGMDDEQCEFFLDMKARMITPDNRDKAIERANNRVEEYNRLVDCRDNKSTRYEYIVNELREIGATKTERKMMLAPIIDERIDKKVVDEISSDKVYIVLSKNGKVKRYKTIDGVNNASFEVGDKIDRIIPMQNNERLLVFTTDGECYKPLANDIDMSRGEVSEDLCKLVGLESYNKIIHVDNAGDYSGYFNIVYSNGKGYRVYYSRANNNRKKNTGLYEYFNKNTCYTTKEDKFFIVTAKRKASYCDITDLGKNVMFSRNAFNGTRVFKGDMIVGIQPVSKIPKEYFDKIDLERYIRAYAVSIGSDILWDPDEIKRTAEEEEREREELEAENKRIEEEKRLNAIAEAFGSMLDDGEDY